jgi:Mn2+/Fe2+ NRAMP family transporter
MAIEGSRSWMFQTYTACANLSIFGQRAFSRSGRRRQSEDRIGSLLLSAIVNGVVAVPIMVVMMMLAVKPGVMGPLWVKRRLLALGWASTAVMAAAVVAMFATM